MESRPTIPDRKLLARLVIVREEARNMMGGGLLDERNDRGFTTLPEAEVLFALVGAWDTGNYILRISTHLVLYIEYLFY
jgi:hypothetical protein